MRNQRRGRPNNRKVAYKRKDQRIIDEIESNPILKAKHEEIARRDALRLEREEFEEGLPAEFKEPGPVASDLSSISEKSLLDAQSLYYRYTPISKISEITGIPVAFVRGCVYRPGGWKEHRDLMSQELTDEVRESELKLLREIIPINLELIKSGLENFKNMGLAPDLETTELLAKIYNKVHNAKIAEEYTENRDEQESLTPEQVMEALAGDPFLLASIKAKQEVIEMADEDFEVIDEQRTHSDSLANPIGPQVPQVGEASKRA